MFKKAVKKQSKLRLAISGPSGAGKTYTALMIANQLGRTAVLDTEHGSASKYADLFEFDALNMEAPFDPRRYIEAIKAASDAGYEVLVIDSLSHAWSGAGGLLEQVDKVAAKMRTSNTFGAWKELTPIQTQMVEALLAAKLHIIATMRSKQEYLVEKDDKGKNQVRKVGLAPVQRDGIEYEFDVFAEMDRDNTLIVSKSRCPALADEVIKKPGKQLAEALKAWLDGAPADELTPKAQAYLVKLQKYQPEFSIDTMREIVGIIDVGLWGDAAFEQLTAVGKRLAAGEKYPFATREASDGHQLGD